MKILLLGATGMLGSRIAAEAARRGHDVTAASRSGLGPAPGGDGQVTAVAVDATDEQALTAVAAGHDVLASALSPPRDGSETVKPFTALHRTLLSAARNAEVRRLVLAGGAGSLLTPSGQALLDSPGFPDAYRPEAEAHRAVLELLRSVSDLDWTSVSPAPEIAPGERTGHYRLGGDRLLDGADHISAEDYAVAFTDELESAAHPQARISVAAA